MTISTATMAEATAWHLRLPTLDERGWESFVLWLEADPANARAYDVLASADRALDDLVAVDRAAVKGERTSVAANDDAVVADAATVIPLPPRRRRWPIAIGGAVAAAAVALVAPLGLVHRAQPYSIQTAPGEIRRIALGDGSSVTLSGASRITLDHGDARVARLDRGEAMFAIHHDAAHPFTLASGEATITDLGTVFDVTRSRARTNVAVVEGSIRFDRAGNHAVMHPGDTLGARDDDAALVLGSMSTAAIGGWQSGRLSFADQPMTMVADALERRYGTVVTLSGSLPEQPFTGMFRLTGSASRDIAHFAAMIGAKARRDGGQWTVSSEAMR